MKLLLDIGNSRIKWAAADAGRLTQAGAAAHDGTPDDLLRELPRQVPEAIWVAQVLGRALERPIQDALQRCYAVPVHVVRVAAECRGLRIAYADPSRLGVDRWLAMLGARGRGGGAVVVASAGTALTLDVVTADGQHLGGFIAPGLQTAREATLGRTRFPTGGFDMTARAQLATQTEAAVLEGALLACLGALDRGAALAPADARRWLLGGDAEALLPHLLGWSPAPDLIFEGLRVLSEPSPGTAADG